jgi:very-short-patch-repair endonuclease
VPSFKVDERFVVGNFSYARLPMVRDLDGSLEAMAEHDLIAALAGDPVAQEALRQAGMTAEIPSPDFTPPSDEFLVLDADSSQNYAINAVLAGRSLIIKGPPGTGKSQTISNLVSTLVARGKRVLFVAEKRAAIDAVLRRLTDVGLDDLVLDLHGGVSSRRQTAQALATALNNNARLSKPELGAVHRQLEQRRSQLTERVEAVHAERPPWGLSFFDVQCQLVALPEEAKTSIRFRGEALDKLGGETIAQATDDLDAYVGLGGLSLSRSQSPWAKTQVVSSEEAQALQRKVESVRAQLDELLARLRRAAEETAVRDPGTLDGWANLLDEWDVAEDALRTFNADVFRLDLEKLLRDGEAMSRSAAARASATITSSEYRSARNLLRDHLVGGLKLKSAETFEAAGEAQGLVERWKEICTDANGTPQPCSDLGDLRVAFDSWEEQFRDLEAKIGAPATEEIPAIQSLLGSLLGDTSMLAKLPRLHQLRSGLERDGLAPLLTELEPQDWNPQDAVEKLRFAWLSSLHEHLQLADPRLGAFDGEQHRQAVSEYQEADRVHVETTSQRVRRRCAEQAISAQDLDPEGAALLKQEAAKKRKHLPIRQLFSAAPEVTLSLKPCWAMSPLVVSQVLPSDQPYFDVVVFDEASQVRPAEAMPSILRGRQLVVAGDERQLPPTDFFSSANPEVEEEEDTGAQLVVDSGYESILEAMSAFVNFRMLEWHYRSRDERLITFSNVYLYDRGLTTFPGVVGPDCIQHVHVPVDPGQPGSAISASAEVEKVIELILDHAEHRPDESLGVIAMGIKHANRLEESLRDALHGRDDLEEFFDETRHEPFFIKNLERVQGDERDAVILSVGYGKNEDGRLLYRFGPLNQDGGERRLNVAVTRSKERMTLVSSFTHHDMDPERSSARGVQLLRAYLEYCATHGAQLGEGASRIPELNPFEIDIRDRLERAGIPLVPQYGSSGYRIDFAAKHPQKPGRMVLAIECDGASYHSAETARDRDRLRQDQLERLGWIFHRIWSQDWFNNKDREIERARQAYEASVKAADEADAAEAAGGSGRAQMPQPVSTPERPAKLVEQLATQAKRTGHNPLRRSPGAGIDDYPAQTLEAFVRWIESDGLLRTKVELRDEVIRELGFRRRGHKIVAAVDRAIDQARLD